MVRTELNDCCFEVWNLLCEKDDSTQRSLELFTRQPTITPNMRSVLLEWIMDVCHDQKLHRETFHLSVDYIDRFLININREFGSRHLQLVGSTALVIAMKMEEIYPPKVHTIADLTAGCCSESEIRDMEVCMLTNLDWNCTPVTAIHWLGLFMQLMGTTAFSDASNTANNKNPVGKRSPPFVHHSPTSSRSSRRSSDGWSTRSRTPQSHLMTSSRRSMGDRNLEAEEDDDEEVEDEESDLEDDMSDESNKENLSDSARLPPYICDSCDAPKHDSSAILDSSYLGQSTYNSSDCHFYPDKRCTVSKLMRDEFIRLATVLDMVLLDSQSLKFKYSELAAAVIWHNYEPESMVQEITGFRRDEIEDALDYVKTFVVYCEKIDPAGVTIPSYSDVSSDDAHNIQTYIYDALDHLKAINEEAQKRHPVMNQRARKRKLCNMNVG